MSYKEHRIPTSKSVNSADLLLWIITYKALFAGIGIEKILTDISHQACKIHLN